MLAFFTRRPILLAFAVITAALVVGFLIYYDMI